jgi:Zn-finger nucleic acid-binding protein
MQCPRKCGVELRSVTLPDLGNAEIHLCPECEGAFYPHLALGEVGQSDLKVIEGTELAVSLVGDKLEKVDLEADVCCPVCSETMNRFSYTLAPQVKLDECFEHGTWLDDGELGVIIEAIAASTASMAEYRKGITDMRKEMNIDGIAKGGSALNPFALTIRLLNSLFSKSRG